MDKNLPVIITRSFQSGTSLALGHKPYDSGFFDNRVKKPIGTMLDTYPGPIIIVCNANTKPGDLPGEIPDKNGNIPTALALHNAFPEEIKEGKIIVHICNEWGNNAGSSSALNEGLKIAQNAKWIFNWSPELNINGTTIKNALEFAIKHNLMIVGVLRENYSQRIQWQFPQNTGCLWLVRSLSKVNGFSTKCNGTGRKISIPNFNEVPVDGMEDFEAMIRMLQQGIDLRWGMIGKENPAKWDVNFPPGNIRRKLQTAKIKSQLRIMEEWARDVYPDRSFEEVLNQLRQCNTKEE